MKTRQLVIVASGISILVLSYFGMNYLAAQKEEPEKKKPEEVKRYVRTNTVSYKELPTEILTFGRVKTAEYLDLIAEVGGRMTQGKVALKEGQKFRKGDLLYRIDDTEARLNLQAQKSNFLRDLAAILPDLKIDYSDNFTNWERYFESIDIEKELPKLPEYKSSKEKTFLATNNIFSTYYNIKSAEVNLRKYRFYAPFDGSIIQLDLRSNSYVNPGSKIARIIQSGDVEVKVDVNVSDIDWIKPGVVAYLSSQDGSQHWKGRVSRIGDYVNTNTQSIDVFITVDERSEFPIYDGQYLKAVIPGKNVENGMLIPREAIFNNNEVFVLQDSLLKVRTIAIHKVNPETVIFSGLPQGHEVVVEPLINAYNNMKAYKLEEKEVDINIEEKSSGNKVVSAN